MKALTLFLIMSLAVIDASGQNLIGYSDKEIRKYMRVNRKDMNINNITNSKFNYLKYSDNGDSQTLLFFLDRDSVCKSIRLICDLTKVDEKTKEFDSIYKKSGDSKWIDERDGKEFLVKIKEEKWSCIITIETDK
jgi:hypothetical protein